MGLRKLIEDARVVTGLDEGFFGDALGRAKRFMQQAARRGDRKAASYWAGVAAHAQDNAAKGGGEKASLADKAKAAVKSAGAAVRNLPANARKFLKDKEYRKEVGKAAAESIKRKGKAALENIKAEGHEFKLAGKALVKVAKRQKLDHHDKTALKAAAKTVASTVAGTVAMGGLSHLTVGALATHFAAETAIKAVGKAALFASVDLREGDEATLRKWMEAVVDGIAEGFEKLGDMDESELQQFIKDEAAEE